MKNMKWTYMIVAAALLVAASASAQKILAGDDGLTTPGGGATKLDLSNFPIREVFGAELKSESVVSLRGESLGSDALEGVDTIVRREKDVDVSNGSGSGPLEIVALRLVGESPVNIGGTDYTLRVFLSEFRSDLKPGAVRFKMTTKDGGTFDSSFPVRPKLVFTDASGNSTAIDCGAVDCGLSGNLTLTAQSANFTLSGGPGGFDPKNSGIKSLPAGLAVDGDGDGKPELKTNASSNLFIGVIPRRPFPIGPVDKNEQFGGSHGVFVPVPAVSASAAAKLNSSATVNGTFTPEKQ